MSETYSAPTSPYATNLLNRFSDTADYVKYRPSYPAAATDTILAGISLILKQLYQSNCDRNGLVYLSYQTIVFIAEPKPKP